MRRRHRALRFHVLAAGMMLAACSTQTLDESISPPSTRPATKTTCPEATLTSGLEPLDRVLVPYSNTLLGVETVWGTSNQRIRVISGGYLDDVLEAYDNLAETGRTRIRNSEATVLETKLLEVPVQVAVWRENEDPPCDTHAVIATGLSAEEFNRQLTFVE